MQRGNSKVGPRLDDELKHDTEGVVRGGHDSRAEEWRGSEPSAEDQPTVGMRPQASAQEGPPDGLSAAEVELRSELASYIGRAPYPMHRSDLLGLLAERHAPDVLVELVAGLPEHVAVVNLQDLWERVHPAA